MPPAKILHVEDDATWAETVNRRLDEEGYAVEWISRGDLFLNKLEEFKPDLILLDMELPGMDGFQIATILARRKGQRPFVIAVSGVYTRPHDKREILDPERNLRADDYLPKPLDLDELLVRIKKCLKAQVARRLISGSIVVDQIARTVTVDDKPPTKALQPRALDLLIYLMQNACIRPGEPVSNDDLLRHLWPEAVGDQAITTSISRMRLSLGRAGSECIKNVPERGYLWACPVETRA